ncbi:endonuclease NucS domain-containing protein [Neobacillus cucumis]|uniref:endonuclease NucS domain-containing protein n=1 Tax=Neobacillus cucumis TaxID=1740721 RepID=UPI00196320FD|nr:endonuclease NucS domain-containing protein [Neobacillus cucumis]MBM7652497.1 hypothetical protein [Neobacillus cucumis]
MHILSEKELEDILVIHPELIEDGLTLLDRQAQLESRRTDLTFFDKDKNILLVELKKDIVTLENVEQITDYVKRLKGKVNKRIRGMLIGQEIPQLIQDICKQSNIEWKEITMQSLFHFLQNEDQDLYKSIFIKGKLHKKAISIPKMSFQEYLNETSPFGVPYSSYQFFKPVDASPELSDDSQNNQRVADAFNKLIMGLNFNRSLFRQQIKITRNQEQPPKWNENGNGSWQGFVIPYTLSSADFPNGLPCEVYLGTIGYRGNKTTFADEKSRFIVVKVGTRTNQMTTQYGFHKYLRTDKKALLPFYELKFNSKGLPKDLWDSMYETLNNYGYFVKDSADKKSSKILWIGDIALDDLYVEEKISNLLEALFALTIVKAHYKGIEKGLNFNVLKN